MRRGNAIRGPLRQRTLQRGAVPAISYRAGVCEMRGGCPPASEDVVGESVCDAVSTESFRVRAKAMGMVMVNLTGTVSPTE